MGGPIFILISSKKERAQEIAGHALFTLYIIIAISRWEISALCCRPTIG